ncbi:hypothetical protein [Asanoa sp. NPDC050611]|uniref:hypothetical protein n=1 Tax=Asanoa sp. NPDC050611 TaxID=3157098 RepID=UPI0033D616EE
MSRDARAEHFADDVVARFAFLVAEFGFIGPDLAEDELVGYAAGPWSIWVGLDLRNKTVETVIKRFEVYAPLGALTAVGLPISAQTRVGMAASLARQAAALRDLVPVLLSPTGPTLMDQAAH